VHQLTAERKALDERLKSARDNNRFLDKRIADLEMGLMDQNRRTDTPARALTPFLAEEAS
jgi:hypothetical protein